MRRTVFFSAYALVLATIFIGLQASGQTPATRPPTALPPVPGEFSAGLSGEFSVPVAGSAPLHPAATAITGRIDLAAEPMNHDFEALGPFPAMPSEPTRGTGVPGPSQTRSAGVGSRLEGGAGRGLVGAAGDMIGFSQADGSGTQTITLVDTRKSWMAVYHIDRSGTIRLVSSRPIDADFSLQLNATSPLPDEIRGIGSARK